MVSGVPTELRSDPSRVAQDFFVTGLGATTSIITAAILAAIDLRFNSSLYSWTVWFVIPAGAICCGFVAASGYYLGARVFNHRPTGILLLNIVAIAIATFFLIHYLNYYLLKIDGKAVRDLLSFSQFLDIEVFHPAVQFSIRHIQMGAVDLIGPWGYLYAALQMLGFAIGGVSVYAHLKSLAYCDACSKYLAEKGIQTRYTVDSSVLTKAVEEIMQCLSAGRFQDAIAAHAIGAGCEEFQKELILRSQMEIKKCKDCNKHWLKFSVSKYSRDDWNDINELGYEGFCAEPISPMHEVRTRFWGFVKSSV